MATPTQLTNFPVLDETEIKEPQSPIPPVTPVRSKTKRTQTKPTPAPHTQRAPVIARWATETEVEEDLKAKFESIDLTDGLDMLARMRRNCETAARILERRRCEESDKTACKTCGITKKQMGNRNWRMVQPQRDPKTGTLFTNYFCSDVCIIADNKAKHGVAAMSDRGMVNTPESLATRAKSSIQAHQEHIRQNKALAALGKQMTKRERKAQRED